MSNLLESPIQLTQELLRFDTTNPPGNERLCIGFIADLLRERGVAHEIVSLDASRPNLILRIAGRGEAPPLLLHGHVDVVPTEGQTWSRDAFAGEIHDGFLWGRGALDMKSGVAMMLTSANRVLTAGTSPAGDIIVAVVSDEEAGGVTGVRYLVEEHPEIFQGVQYAIGEFGAFPLELGGVRFYPIQVAERIPVRIRLMVRGHSGHGSLPSRRDVPTKLGRLLRRLENERLPIHLTAATDMMFDAMARHLRGTERAAIKALANPKSAGATLRAGGQRLAIMEPVLRNTVTVTGVSGGTGHNVKLAEAAVDLDGRLLPGFSAEDLIGEIGDLIGPNVEISYQDEGLTNPGAAPDMGLFSLLAELIQNRVPDAKPVPFLMPATTDGRFLKRLGIQHYGYLPMTFPSGFAFSSTVHAADERIPPEAIEFGSDVMTELLTRYPG